MVSDAPVTKGRTSSGSVHSRRPPKSWLVSCDSHAMGSASCARVVRVDIGRDAARPAHGTDGERVVEVPVREQHGDRTEPVLGQDLLKVCLDPDARVDDHAVLAGTGRDDVAVGRESLRGEAHDEHGGPPPGRCGTGSVPGTGRGYRRGAPARPTGPRPRRSAHPAYTGRRRDGTSSRESRPGGQRGRAEA